MVDTQWACHLAQGHCPGCIRLFCVGHTTPHVSPQHRVNLPLVLAHQAFVTSPTACLGAAKHGWPIQVHCVYNMIHAWPILAATIVLTTATYQPQHEEEHVDKVQHVDNSLE
jgi:hypothetical protein